MKQNSLLLKNTFQIPVVVQDNRSQRMLPLVEEKMKILMIPVYFSTANILKLFCGLMRASLSTEYFLQMCSMIFSTTSAF